MKFFHFTKFEKKNGPKLHVDAQTKITVRIE